jgi:uncharacterized protein YecT (DUF1311 family)
MMVKSAFLIASVAVVLSVASAWAQPPEPIDEAIKACLGTNDGATTAGMLDCYGKAASAWDRRLTVAYAKLMKTLDPASKASLLAAERGWVAFREKDAAFQGAPWRQNTGTLSSVVFAGNNVEQIKARVYDLEFYISGG